MVGCEILGMFNELRNISPDCVISGLHTSNSDEVYGVLKESGLDSSTIDVLLNTHTDDNIVYEALFKAKSINDLSLKTYYETNPLIHHFLVSACPKTQILLITNKRYLSKKTLDEFENTVEYMELTKVS